MMVFSTYKIKLSFEIICFKLNIAWQRILYRKFIIFRVMNIFNA